MCCYIFGYTTVAFPFPRSGCQERPFLQQHPTAGGSSSEAVANSRDCRKCMAKQHTIHQWGRGEGSNFSGCGGGGGGGGGGRGGGGTTVTKTLLRLCLSISSPLLRTRRIGAHLQVPNQKMSLSLFLYVPTYIASIIQELTSTLEVLNLHLYCTSLLGVSPLPPPSPPLLPTHKEVAPRKDEDVSVFWKLYCT